VYFNMCLALYAFVSLIKNYYDFLSENMILHDVKYPNKKTEKNSFNKL